MVEGGCLCDAMAVNSRESEAKLLVPSTGYVPTTEEKSLGQSEKDEGSEDRIISPR
jgi:hypothetical protein